MTPKSRSTKENNWEGNIMQHTDGPSFDLDDLPMEVFELTDRGLTVETLTAGHGLTEYGASSVFSCSSSS